MKRTVIALMLLACIGAAPALASNDGHDHKATGVHQHDLDCVSELFTEMIKDERIAGMMEKLELYKKAGLSYQPQLAAPRQLDCKSDEQLRVLLGMYLFDSNYALVFGKAKETLETKKFIREQVVPRLRERDHVETPAFDPKVVQALMEDPDDEDARSALRNAAVENVARLTEKAKHDPEVMELLVESFYGGVIQGVYVAASMAQDLPFPPNMKELFEAQLERLELFDEIIDSIGHEEYKIMLEYSERDEIVDAIKDLIKQSEGAISGNDIENILALATKARKQYVGPCE